MPPTVRTENKYGLDWVLLNNRWYCVQNYSPTHLADGTPIPIVTDATTWAGLETPARCLYNNSTDAEFIAKYGYLYNWYGIDEGLEMPCEGCVVPSSAEWESLRDWMIANGFNWDETTTGNKIAKALASSGGEWANRNNAGDPGNNQASNNSSGLTMLPGGRRFEDGSFNGIAAMSYIWARNLGNSFYIWNFDALARFSTGISSTVGYSIRISRPRAKMFLPPQLIYQGL